MIRLPVMTISSDVLNELQSYQREIDKQPIYHEQVAWAKKLWKPKSQNKLFGDEIRPILAGVSKKCHYCEQVRARDIEHFRPISIYPNLAFSWENYLFGCSVCNRAKSSKFAIFDENGDIIHLKPSQFRPKDGDSVLINPRFEDPLYFFRMNFQTFFLEPQPYLTQAEKERVKYTINTLKLNKEDLPNLRKQAFKVFIGWVKLYAGYQQPHHSPQLQNHIDELKNYPHIFVWEEMRRVYLERDEGYWQILNYTALNELKIIFDEVPDVLKYTFQG